MLPNRVVTFELRSSSLHPAGEMASKIAALTKSVYGVDLRKEIEEAGKAPGLGWENYYRKADGAKVTKTLTGLLRNRLDKAIVEANFAVYGNRVSQLYEPQATVRSFFADKNLIGEGKYESGQTCLAFGKTNESNKQFLIRYHRAGLLVIEKLTKTGKEPTGSGAGRARCIAFFSGGRNIYLTNFYYNCFANNRLVFIEALRRILNLDKVMWGFAEDYFLPIYRNGDTIRVYTPGAKKTLSYKRRLPCPVCHKMVPEDDLYYKEDGSLRLLGCSERCAKISGKQSAICIRCEREFSRGNFIHINGRPYCIPGCVGEVAFRCCRCDNYKSNSEAHQIVNSERPACNHCVEAFPVCHVCNRRCASPRAIMHGEGKIVHVCAECIAEKKLKCAMCGKIVLSEMAKGKKAGRIVKVCMECNAGIPKAKPGKRIEIPSPDEDEMEPDPVTRANR